jgi:ATP-dependent DNA helicase RecQ
VPAQKLLSTIVRLKRERNQSFGAGQIIDILRGKRTDRVAQQRHDELATFGIGEDLSDQEWRGVVRQLLARDLLATVGEYGTLGLTEGSAEVLAGSRPVAMRREPERAARSSSRSSSRSAGANAELEPAAAELFQALRAWRAGVAKEQGFPAYIVFGDATLRAVASAKPTSLGELDGISGIGAKKLDAYGAALVEVVSANS